jgi:hypothetical protein
VQPSTHCLGGFGGAISPPNRCRGGVVEGSTVQMQRALHRGTPLALRLTLLIHGTQFFPFSRGFPSRQCI